MKRTTLAAALGGALAVAALACVPFGYAVAEDAPSGHPPPQKPITHPYLTGMVGEWKVSFVATDPTGKPQEGTATSKVVLGVAGSALLEDYKSEMGGGAFEGHGVTKISDDGKRVTTWWFDNMMAEPIKLSGPVTDTTIELNGSIPGMGEMKIVSKKVEGGYDWDATLGGKPMLTQKYRK